MGCGIAGFVSVRPYRLYRGMLLKHRRDVTELPAVFRDSLLAMHRRGPDEKGVYCDEHVALLSARLSIIDVEGSHQPLQNEDGSVVMVFNGEIYNYRELRRHLRAHSFKTDGDGETFVHLYEELGFQEALKCSNGMFAVALYDRIKKTLYLARDRCGQKPLYYALYGGVLAFASEPKALLPLLYQFGMRPSISVQGLLKFLENEYIPAPYTIYEGVEKLEAAHFLAATVDGEKLRLEKREYWTPLTSGDRRSISGKYSTSGTHSASHRREGELLHQFAELFKSATEYRLISDVPLGVLISGGLDSTVVTHFVYRVCGGEPVAFSVSFRERSFDESRYFLAVSRYYGMEHRVFTLESDFENTLAKVLEYMDEPHGDTSLLPTYLLFERIKDAGYRVVLTGDGGDELFAGYPTYIAHRLASLPGVRFLSKPGLMLSRLLPTTYANMNAKFLAMRFFSGLGMQVPDRNNYWVGGLHPEEMRALLKPRYFEVYREISHGEARAHYNYAFERTGSVQKALQYLDFRMYLGDGVLAKVDRMSMANSVESRSPFLDHRVVEFAFSLPDRFMLRGTETKVFLRRFLRRETDLPAFVTERRKKGFGAPVSRYLLSLGERRLLAEIEKSPAVDFFKFENLKEYVKYHFEKKADMRKVLWNVYVLAKWWSKLNGG